MLVRQAILDVHSLLCISSARGRPPIYQHNKERLRELHVPQGGAEQVILAVQAHDALLQVHLPLAAAARHLLKLPHQDIGDVLIILLVRLAAHV